MSSLFLVKAYGGEYEDQWERIVCWFPEQDLAINEAFRMHAAATAWSKKHYDTMRLHDWNVSSEDETLLAVEARKDIGDEWWRPGDDTYSWFEVRCGMSGHEALERLAMNIMAKAKEAT